MTLHRRSDAAKVIAQLTKLSHAAPRVVAHRVGRMTASGLKPSARDRREFAGMVAEKPIAFTRALQNMWFAGVLAQQDLLIALSRALVQPPWVRPVTGTKIAQQMRRAGLEVLSQGLAPIERKASSNARRLSKGKKHR